MTTRPARGVLSPLSLVVSLLALVLAVGTTAYAAGLARNSVGTPQLKKNAVTTPKIKKNAVTGAKVRNGSLRAGDLAPGLLPRTRAFEHGLAPGETAPTLVFAGMSFQPSCQSAGGNVVVSQVVIRPAVAGANDLTASGTTVRQKGATATSNVVYGTGNGSSFEPSAEGDLGTTAHTGFEGVLRSGSGPWVHVSLQLRSNVVQTPICRMRAVLTPTR